jgi:hypothetical protein
MVGVSDLWMPIVVSAVFVLIALLLIHGAQGRHDLTNSLDGIIYALITGATFGWLWPH